MRSAYGESPVLGPEVASTYDDVPLWSAPFGLRLLDTVRLRAGITALDVGCGTGFPLVELAERLGRTSHVHGVDPWADALTRVRAKLAVRGVANVTLHEAAAEHLPLPDGAVDLVVSNNGLNNVADLGGSLDECARVARPGAQLVCTWNLPETMHEVYALIGPALSSALGDAEEAARRIRGHVHAKRKTVAFMQERVEEAGFAVERVRRDAFTLDFVDGTAMFDHSFMRIAFVGPWLELVEEPRRLAVFHEVEERLNALAADRGALRLSVPFACLDARRLPL